MPIMDTNDMAQPEIDSYSLGVVNKSLPPQTGSDGAGDKGAMMIDAIPRPEVSAERYRDLEVIAMQTMMQLPHQDLGECLIIRDIQTNILRRWLSDERMARHQPVDALAEAINEGIVARLPKK